jgi:hypothetical protein
MQEETRALKKTYAVIHSVFLLSESLKVEWIPFIANIHAYIPRLRVSIVLHETMF